MKRLIFVAIFLAQLPTYAQYQVQKGRWFINHQLGGYSINKHDYEEFEDDVPQEKSTYKNHGFNLSFSGPEWGSIEYNAENNGSGSSKSKNSGGGIYLAPEVGYFIKDNLMIGTSVILGFESSKYDYATDQNGKGHEWALGIGPMLRYYAGKNTKRKPFVGFESRLEYSKSKDKENYHSDLSEYEGKNTRFMVTPYAGYALFIGKHWTANARVEFTYVKDTDVRTSWFYENGVLATYSPEENKYVGKHYSYGLGFGLSYTF